MADVEEEVNDCCSCMMQELRTLCDLKKATVTIKVAPDAERGTNIAAEAEKAGATWVVLDKHVMSAKDRKVCMEQLHCNVVLVKQGKSSKILRLNLKHSSNCSGEASKREIDQQHSDSELARTVSYHEKPWQDTNMKGVSDLALVYNGRRRGKANIKKASARRSAILTARHQAHHCTTGHTASSFYDGIDDHSSESSPEVAHITAKSTDPFTTESDTDSNYTGARDELHYNVGSMVCREEQLHLDPDHEDGSIFGYGELDFFVNSSCTGRDEQLHSGILCTPATSCSTASPTSVEDPTSDLQSPVTLRQGFEHSPYLRGRQSTDWFNTVAEGVYAARNGPSPPGKLVPNSNILTFTCSSKPDSASTTPKSETLTLTGSSYQKASRSPSPASASANQHQPLFPSGSSQHAPRPSQAACITARASRSPSPAKSNCITLTSPPSSCTVGGVKLLSSLSPSLACPSTLLTSPREKQMSRSHLLTSPDAASHESVIWSSSGESQRHHIIGPSRCKTETPSATTANHPITTESTKNGSITLRSSDRAVTTRELMQRFAEWDHQGSTKYERSSSSAIASSGSFRKVYTNKGGAHVETELNERIAKDLQRTSSVRRAMSILGGDAEYIFRHPAPPGPPPLCSICQHKAPVFGKPPRRFSYAELEMATGGFSKANFLAEGGFGSVHRGILPDGQAVAVKQHKLASSQGDIEFCSEVEVLSCAQHRNVVMLIGYCIEDSKRLLVYEFICNGSLYSHVHGDEGNPLPWAARQKVAVGAARGLRYLHEECRVGCIIHRDVRPNNILLTHDYEPMVGDFGLARWQPDGDLGVQTRVIGTFGYLAPEYAQSGEVTEKADVYSFGVVLLELVTGRKAVELARPKGQQCLTEWARPLLEEGADMDQMLDPRLPDFEEYELFCALHAAALCIRKDPHQRPRMSQVLRILEGDVVIDHSGPTTPLYFGRQKLHHQAEQPPSLGNFNGSRSDRISSEYDGEPGGAGAQVHVGSRSPPLISYSGSLLTGTGSRSSHFAVPLGSSTRRRSADTFQHSSTTKLDIGSYHHAGNALRSLTHCSSDAYSKRFSFEGLH